jgi:hypothetical protein
MLIVQMDLIVVFPHMRTMYPDQIHPSTTPSIPLSSFVMVHKLNIFSVQGSCFFFVINKE